MLISREEAVKHIIDGQYDLIADGKSFLEKVDPPDEYPSLPIVYVFTDEPEVHYTISEVTETMNAFSKFEESGGKYIVLQVSGGENIFAQILS